VAAGSPSGGSMTQHSLRYSRVPGQFAICRLASDARVLEWAMLSSFLSLTRTADELSIVCAAHQVPSDVKHEPGWSCFKLEGPFPFTMTGVLSSFLRPLAEAGIPILAISTFDTDYVLVKETTLEVAMKALHSAGHSLIAE
jgi:uncharacterized protein